MVELDTCLGDRTTRFCNFPIYGVRLPWCFSWSRIHLQCRRPWFNSWVRKICWRRDRLHTAVFLGFPCGSAGKESACNVGDLGLIHGLGRFPGEGNGYPLQYSGLENSIDCIVHGIAKSGTQLSDFHFQRGHKDFPIAQILKNLPAMQETWVQFLGWEDHLKKGIATY